MAVSLWSLYQHTTLILTPEGFSLILCTTVIKLSSIIQSLLAKRCENYHNYIRCIFKHHNKNHKITCGFIILLLLFILV